MGIDKKDFGPAEKGRYSFEAGYKAMQKLLKSGKKVTGVFALADVMAIGAISAISDAGLSVPGDVSVIGYDGIPIGAYFCPKLFSLMYFAVPPISIKPKNVLAKLTVAT